MTRRAGPEPTSHDRSRHGYRTPRDLVTGLAIGVAATAAMSASTAVETRLRPGIDHPVNYDASKHVAQAVGTVLDRPPQTATERRGYTLLAHWGYGSAVALAYPLLRPHLRGDVASALAFTAATQGMASVLFPTIGGTPPPQRWSRATTLSSVVHHAVYSGTVAIAWRRVRA